MLKNKNIFLFIAFIYFPFFLFPSNTFSAEPPLVNFTFTESFDNFPNPERGFHRYTIFRGLQQSTVSGLRAQGISLILGVTIVNDYKDKDFDAALFNQLNNAFNVVRNAGLKVNFRLYYTDKNYQDPPLARMLSHINQLKQIFVENYEVINLVEAGFIGPWGEWHSSNLGNPPTVENMRAVLFALLDALPPQRMVSIRRPMFKRQIYSLPNGGYEILDETSAFNESQLARTGYHDDAFVTSSTDLGTYVATGWTRDMELAYAGNECRFTPFGGESSYADPLHEYTHCDRSVYELETLHARYLNDGWYGPVLERWTNEGCMDEIKRRLGYRFVLRNMQISEEVKPGGVLHLVLTLHNVGFGSLFNPRDVELILQNGSTMVAAPIFCDPRRWESGSEQTLDLYFRIPATLPEGYYAVKLNLPDPAPSLRSNPLYAIRFANEGVWEAATGYNVLTQNLHIHSSARGSANNDTEFFQIENPFDIQGAVSGHAYAGIQIQLFRYDGCSKSLYLTTQTDSSGAYTFKNLPQGTYAIEPVSNIASFTPTTYDLIKIPHFDNMSYDFLSLPGGACQ